MREDPDNHDGERADRSALQRAGRLAVLHRNPVPVVRALAAENLYFAVRDGKVLVSVSGSGRLVHAFTSAARMSELAGADATAMVGPLPQWARGWPRGTGVRLDPEHCEELRLDPAQVREVVQIAAGLPTRAALQVVPGEELIVHPGPALPTDLDRRMMQVVGRHTGVRRLELIVHGVGGRAWPCYLLDAAESPVSLRARIEEQVGPHNVLLINGHPAWLVNLLRSGLRTAIMLQ